MRSQKPASKSSSSFMILHMNRLPGNLQLNIDESRSATSNRQHPSFAARKTIEGMGFIGRTKWIDSCRKRIIRSCYPALPGGLTDYARFSREVH